MQTLGSRIKAIRTSEKLKQADFAKRVLVSASYISKVESNKEVPSDIFIKLLSLEFNVSYEWLKNGTGERELSSLSDFDTRTDSGNIVKFEFMNQKLVEYLKKIDGEELKLVVNIISYFQSSLINEDFIDKEKRILYLENLEKIIKTLEITFSKAHTLCSLKDSPNDYKALLSFSSSANEYIYDVNNSIRNILNLYVEQILKENLSFKVF